MATTLYTATDSLTVRDEAGADYVLREGVTQLAEGHPIVKERPDLFERSDAEPDTTRKRQRRVKR